MGEEIEVLRVAMQGIEMTAKLGETAMKDALLLFKYLFSLIPKTIEWSQEATSRRLKNKMTKQEIKDYKEAVKKMNMGNISFEKFNKTYNANERQLIQVPDTSLAQFVQLAEKYGIAYSIMPDNNLNDGLKEIMVTTLQAEALRKIMDAMADFEKEKIKEEIGELSAKEERIDKKINEYEKLLKREDVSEEAKDIYRERIKHLKEAKKQLEEKVNLAKNMTTGNISLQDYISRNRRCIEHSDILTKEMDAGIKEYGAFSLKEVLNENPIVMNYSKDLSENCSYVQSIACPNVYLKKEVFEKEIYLADKDAPILEKVPAVRYTLYVDGEPTDKIFEKNAFYGNEAEEMEFFDSVRQQLNDEIDKKISAGENVYSGEMENWTEVPDMDDVKSRVEFTKKNPLSRDGMSIDELFKEAKVMKKADRRILSDIKKKITNIAKGNIDMKKYYIEFSFDITMITKSKTSDDMYNYYIDKDRYIEIPKKSITDINKENGIGNFKLNIEDDVIKVNVIKDGRIINENIKVEELEETINKQVKTKKEKSQSEKTSRFGSRNSQKGGSRNATEKANKH